MSWNTGLELYLHCPAMQLIPCLIAGVFTRSGSRQAVRVPCHTGHSVNASRLAKRPFGPGRRRGHRQRYQARSYDGNLQHASDYTSLNYAGFTVLSLHAASMIDVPSWLIARHWQKNSKGRVEDGDDSKQLQGDWPRTSVQHCGTYGGRMPHPSRWQHRDQRPSGRAWCRGRDASCSCQIMHHASDHAHGSASAKLRPARGARQSLGARGPSAALRAGCAVLMVLAMAAVGVPTVRLLMRTAWHSLGSASQSSIQTRICMHQAGEHTLQALCVDGEA